MATDNHSEALQLANSHEGLGPVPIHVEDDSKESSSQANHSQGPASSSDTSEKDTNESNDSADDDSAHGCVTKAAGSGSEKEKDKDSKEGDTTQGNSGSSDTQGNSQGSSDTPGNSEHNNSGNSDASNSNDRDAQSGVDSAPVQTECSAAEGVWERSDDDVQPLPSVLLVKNINHRTTVPEFCRLLEENQFPLCPGKVTLVHIPCSRKRRNARGFAVVHCATPEVANELRAAFHGRKFGRHRVLNVEHATRVEPRLAFDGEQEFPPEYEPALVNPSDAIMLGLPVDGSLLAKIRSAPGPSLSGVQ